MAAVLTFIAEAAAASWEMLQESAIYIIFGLVVGGLLKTFLSAAYVSRHLGSGRISSVVKAALFGIPIPLCSCGVLPAAAALQKQGANKGATTAFLISTPESGVDSISITYALLDPLMTLARPLSAFITALAAGISENMLHPPRPGTARAPDPGCRIDSCTSGEGCSSGEHGGHSGFRAKCISGLRYARDELWSDLAGWFFLGIVLAGLITVFIPETFIGTYLGGGLSSMLLMLLFGIPLYICATASTPVAAALILKGVSPGAALVFLLVGPATNITSLSVLIGLLGKRTTVLYLTTIAVVSVLCGLALDQVYAGWGISARAMAGQAAEVVPSWLKVTAAIVLLVLSVRPLANGLRRLAGRRGLQDFCGCGGECSPAAPTDTASTPLHILPLAPPHPDNKEHDHLPCRKLPGSDTDRSPSRPSAPPDRQMSKRS